MVRTIEPFSELLTLTLCKVTPLSLWPNRSRNMGSLMLKAMIGLMRTTGSKSYKEHALQYEAMHGSEAILWYACAHAANDKSPGFIAHVLVDALR
jgi:hypothetical protein